MLPPEHPDRIRVAFDDHRLVANAGLLLPATLALRLGRYWLTGTSIWVASPAGLSPAPRRGRRHRRGADGPSPGGPGNTARGADHFLRETVSRVRYAGATGQLTVRADSGFYNHAVVQVCRKTDVRFSITVRLSQSLRNLIEAVPEADWRPIPYWMEGGADVAETGYTPFQSQTGAAPVRLIVRRVRPTPGSQLALFANYSYHAFITDRNGDTLELEADHRRHAEIENAIRDLKSRRGPQPRRSLAGGARSWPTIWPAGPSASLWGRRWQPPRPCGDASSPWLEGSPARPASSPCTCPGAGPGKPSLSLLWYGCGPFHCPFDAIPTQGNPFSHQTIEGLAQLAPTRLARVLC